MDNHILKSILKQIQIDSEQLRSLKMLQSALLSILIISNHSRCYTDIEKYVHYGRVEGSKNVRGGTAICINDYIERNPRIKKLFSIEGSPHLLFGKRRSRIIFYITRLITESNQKWSRVQIQKRYFKMLVALPIIISGYLTDCFEEVSNTSEDFVRSYLCQICSDIILVCGDRVFNILTTLSELDKRQLQYTDIGFPGCIGEVDFMKYKINNCQETRKGHFKTQEIQKAKLDNSKGDVIMTYSFSLGFPCDLSLKMTWMFKHDPQQTFLERSCITVPEIN